MLLVEVSSAVAVVDDEDAELVGVAVGCAAAGIDEEDAELVGVAVFFAAAVVDEKVAGLVGVAVFFSGDSSNRRRIDGSAVAIVGCIMGKVLTRKFEVRDNVMNVTGFESANADCVDRSTRIDQGGRQPLGTQIMEVVALKHTTLVERNRHDAALKRKKFELRPLFCHRLIDMT